MSGKTPKKARIKRAILVPGTTDCKAALVYAASGSFRLAEFSQESARMLCDDSIQRMNACRFQRNHGFVAQGCRDLLESAVIQMLSLEFCHDEITASAENRSEVLGSLRDNTVDQDIRTRRILIGAGIKIAVAAGIML